MAFKIPLYLSTVIGALNGVLVLLSAGVTLAITLAISLATLNDNGATYTTTLANSAIHNVGAFFRVPEHQVEMAAREARRSFTPFPMEVPTANLTEAEYAAQGIPPGGVALQRWSGFMSTMVLSDNATYLAGGYTFLDGSQINCLLAPLGDEHAYAITTLRVNSSNEIQASSMAFDQRTKLPMPPGSAAYNLSYDRPNQPSDDIRTQPHVRQVWEHALTYPTGPRWGPPRIFVMPYGLFVYVFVASRITNASGTLLGFASRLVGLGDVGTILDGVKVSEGSVAFAVDRNGVLLGASGGIPVYNVTYDTEPAAPKEPCVSTSQGVTTSSRFAVVCRFHASESADRRIRDVAAGGFLDHRSFHETKLHAGGTEYFAAIRQVPRLGMDVRVVTLVPEEDVLGGIERILWITLLAAAVVVVVGASTGAAAVWFLLRPLAGIAQGMAAAARFAESEASSCDPRSMMREISALQDAFASMSRELTRIRSFVPQSLLVAGDTEEDLAQAALLEESHGEDSCRQSSYHRGSEVEDRNDDCTTLSVANSSFSSAKNAVTATRTFRCSVLSASTLTGASNASEASTNSASASAIKSLARGHQGTTRSSMSHTAASRRASRAKAAAHHVRISTGVRLSSVTILSVNLRGFHAATAPNSGNGGLSASKIAETVAAVLRVVDAQRGVVDSFLGDRFLISFNAARPAANHTIRGAVAAAQVIRSLQNAAEAAYALPVSCGVATGLAQVGNVGCSALKRFSIVGPVVSQAACLERLCKLYPGAECLVPQRALADIQTAVKTRTLDLVQLPFASKPCLVAVIVGEHEETHGDEWMYQLKAQASAACHANDAWLALAAGKLEDTKSALELALTTESAPREHMIAASGMTVLSQMNGSRAAATSALRKNVPRV